MIQIVTDPAELRRRARDRALTSDPSLNYSEWRYRNIKGGPSADTDEGDPKAYRLGRP